MSASSFAETMSDIDWPTFAGVVERRKSVRAFTPQCVPVPVIRRIFDLARWSPSNCNTQPWCVHLVGGPSLKELRLAMIAVASSPPTPDIPYRPDLYPQHLRERQTGHVQAQQEAMGIERGDANARQDLRQANLRFFDAPHVAFLCMPAFGNEREAADIGMYAQTLMLGMTAHGLASVPQTSIGMYAAPVRRHLNLPQDQKLLFAISFGYEDRLSSNSRLEQGRAELDEQVQFHD